MLSGQQQSQETGLGEQRFRGRAGLLPPRGTWSNAFTRSTTPLEWLFEQPINPQTPSGLELVQYSTN